MEVYPTTPLREEGYKKKKKKKKKKKTLPFTDAITEQINMKDNQM
jgi:radical SAM superfamily enzyme with C-terminal helix-hairpin-helix motif